MKSLLKIDDLSKKVIQEILNVADQLKYEKANGIAHPLLKGKTIGLIYNKPCGRSVLSFSTAASDLGGTLLQLNTKDIESWGEEPLSDSIGFLCRYLDCMVLRGFSWQQVESIASFSSIPVINALSQSFHPCQSLADLMTIREKKGVFQNRKLALISCGGPIPRSLILGASKMGMEVCLCCPEAEKLSISEDFTFTSDIQKAAEDADVVYVCPYPKDMEWNGDLKRYQVNNELLALSKAGVLVMHPLPARRGYEIDSNTFDCCSQEIFDEAENSLHIQKAVMVLCMKGSD